MAEQRFKISEDMAPIFSDFLGEAPQLLAAMESTLLELSKNQGRGQIDPLLRSLHTLKGIFGFLGMEAMQKLCHESENALSPFAAGSPLGKADIERSLADCDLIRAQVAEVRQGYESRSFLLVDSASAAPQQDESTAQENFIRVRVEKMNALFELVGEMAICQAQVGEGLEAVALPPALHGEVGRLGKISRELQKTVQALRLVPVEPLFLRASRMAHDLSLKTGKPIAFESQGRETELDKGLVEELAEPLLHLIRNAVDHGLESEGERRSLGKAPQGRISLRASQQGGDFLMELEDDGRGVDLAKVARRGRALGLISAADEQDQARIQSLIFEPGFSTAETVSELSGRGVGLDAVRSRIRAMKGEIQLSSEKGRGCRFSIRLPMTMALVDGILVSLGGGRYVVPAAQIRKFVAMDSCTGHQVSDGRAWLVAGDDSLPVIDFEGPGGLPALHGERPGARRVALHVESLGREAALIVDEVLGKQQVVAKGLEGALKDMHGISGGAILGDGRVSLILDLEALMGRRRASAAAV